MEEEEVSSVETSRMSSQLLSGEDKPQSPGVPPPSMSERCRENGWMDRWVKGWMDGWMQR